MLSFLALFVQIPLVCMGITSCDNAHDEVYEIKKINIHYDSDSLRVLVLGNSFSYDGIIYLDELARATHIDNHRFCVYNGFIGGGGIQEWTDVYNSGDTVNLTKMAGGIDMNHSAPLRELLQQKWEVCVILQGSHLSYKWSSFENGTDHLISLIKSHSLYPQIKIAYAMPWSHTPVNTPTELPGNIKCAKKLILEHDVDFIIPVGTAIQNARASHIDNGRYLTRDDWHLCFGVGRYIAACTWYETLLEPFFHVSISGRDASHTLTLSEQEDPTSLPVTDDNRSLCQQCAYQAVQNPFNVTELAGAHLPAHAYSGYSW